MQIGLIGYVRRSGRIRGILHVRQVLNLRYGQSEVPDKARDLGAICTRERADDVGFLFHNKRVS